SPRPFEYRFCTLTCSELYHTFPTGLSCRLKLPNCGNGSKSCCFGTVDAFKDVPGSRFWNGFGTRAFRLFGLPPFDVSPNAMSATERKLKPLVTAASYVREPT